MDDAFLSIYKKAWPILKKKKIPQTNIYPFIMSSTASVDIDNLNKVYVIATVDGENVQYTYFN